MRAVVQRVSSASVVVGDRPVARIGKGLLALIGVRKDDTEADAEWIARKIAELRIFDDVDGKLNLSVEEVHGELLLVPNFTLYGDATKGRRPSYVEAAQAEAGKVLFDRCTSILLSRGLKVCTGEFGAEMAVSLTNDGPVTILLDSATKPGGDG